MIVPVVIRYSYVCYVAHPQLVSRCRDEVLDNVRVCRESVCGVVRSPLRAGLLLFGVSFFSYRNLEFGLRHVDHLIVEFSLDLCS